MRRLLAALLLLSPFVPPPVASAAELPAPGTLEVVAELPINLANNAITALRPNGSLKTLVQDGRLI